MIINITPQEIIEILEYFGIKEIPVKLPYIIKNKLSSQQFSVNSDEDTREKTDTSEDSDSMKEEIKPQKIHNTTSEDMVEDIEKSHTEEGEDSDSMEEEIISQEVHNIVSKDTTEEIKKSHTEEGGGSLDEESSLENYNELDEDINKNGNEDWRDTESSITDGEKKQLEFYGINDIYEDKYIGTLDKNSVEAFFNKFKAEDNWNGLHIGNRIKILDGLMDMEWIIAGFNTECDYDVYDVDTPCSKGIFLIPTKNIEYINYNEKASELVAFINSDLYAALNEEEKYATALKGVFGDHLVMRRIRIGAAIDEDTGRTCESAETAGYLTILSLANFDLDDISYDDCSYNYDDDGEAIYTLPLFKKISLKEYANKESFWLRNIKGYGYCGMQLAWEVDRKSRLSGNFINASSGLRFGFYIS